MAAPSEPANRKTFPVTWDELHRHARALAWRLLDLGPWQGIVAVTRGGLVPAAIVARELDIRLVDTDLRRELRRPRPRRGRRC